jgi:hypothetical protein
MATDLLLPADLSTLTLDQLAALPTIGEVLAHINRDGTYSVPVTAFNSSI